MPTLTEYHALDHAERAAARADLYTQLDTVREQLAERYASEAARRLLKEYPTATGLLVSFDDQNIAAVRQITSQDGTVLYDVDGVVWGDTPAWHAALQSETDLSAAHEVSDGTYLEEVDDPSGHGTCHRLDFTRLELPQPD